MIYSLNEIQNTVYKAARGGGLSWGLAEEAGRAAVWLSARQFPAQFSGALIRRGRLCLPDEKTATTETLTPSASDKMLCPFATGVYISDCAGGGARRRILRRAAFPLIIAPFAARTAPPGGCISISWAGVFLLTDGKNITATKREGLLSRCADIEITPCAAPVFPPREDSGGGQIAAAEWRRLQTLAARTQMPSTEDSRAQDAGAAETD